MLEILIVALFVFAHIKLMASFPTSANNMNKYHLGIFLLLMEEILHQLIDRLSHYLQGFIHPRWLFGISSINSIISSTGRLGQITHGSSKWRIQLSPGKTCILHQYLNHESKKTRPYFPPFNPGWLIGVDPYFMGFMIHPRRLT